MEKTFTLNDFIEYSNNKKSKEKSYSKPSKQVLTNILNFSKSYKVVKTSSNKNYEMILN